ncbi:2547_t:CDS:2 [Ambispora leptoticha]|uniref:2547_t:CDS:1 n=1 Tax=Ambispora leptoticha TaxID=144679 RepID=A0A9N9CHY6_9GLOM|nr:2547_t:CDS:2 [Ambispora leptoticha]
MPIELQYETHPTNEDSLKNSSELSDTWEVKVEQILIEIAQSESNTTLQLQRYNLLGELLQNTS